MGGEILEMIVVIGVVETGCGLAIVVFLWRVVGGASVLEPGGEDCLHPGGRVGALLHQLILFKVIKLQPIAEIYPEEDPKSTRKWKKRKYYIDVLPIDSINVKYLTECTAICHQHED